MEPTFIVFTVNVLVCSSRYKDKYKNMMKLKRKEFSGGFVRSLENILLKIIVVEGPLSALRLVSDQLFIKCIEIKLHYTYV